MHPIVPRLVTFDVTGTLLMTKLGQHYAEAAARHGYPGQLDKPRLERSFIASYRKLEAEHPIYGRHTGLGWENWWRTIVQDVFYDQDRGIARDKLDKIADSLMECYSTSRCWHKYPGTLELLDSLSRRGVILGVISNFDERLEAVLDSTRIRSYFAFVLTSYGLGVEKPKPAIFQEALRLSSLEQIEAVRPEEAVHIGDRLDNDYLGARAAGWNAILMDRDGSSIKDREHLDPQDVVTNFHELKDRFESLFARAAAHGR